MIGTNKRNIFSNQRFVVDNLHKCGRLVWIRFDDIRVGHAVIKQLQQLDVLLLVLKRLVATYH